MTNFTEAVIARQVALLEQQTDATAKAQAIVPAEHRMIHLGKVYSITDVQNVSTTTLTWQITTPAGAVYAHMLVDVECTGEVLAVITEGSDKINGTALAEINRNRVIVPTASTVIVTRTPTGGTTVGATVLHSIRAGSTGNGAKTVANGQGRAGNEFILKPSTKYVVSATTYANVFVTLSLNWYVE